MITIKYADLRDARSLENLVLHSEDLSQLKKWIIVQVLRQLVSVDRRPLNWLHAVEVNICFDRVLREKMLNESLDYAHVKAFLQGVFEDWKVEFAESPVGTLPFNFFLKQSLRPSGPKFRIPTIDHDLVLSTLNRTAGNPQKELRVCPGIS